MISMKDISAACGVSVATVSKALNDHKDVGEETKERMRKVLSDIQQNSKQHSADCRGNVPKHSQFGGTWLSDYVSNELGGYLGERVKPDCALIGENGNIFHLAGKAAQTLKQNGMRMEAREMLDKVMNSGSYDEALGVIGDYVNITDGSESEDFDEGQGMSL